MVDGLAGAVPLLKRAIEIDPKFAMAHASLGFIYGLMGQLALSEESNRRAYELRDRVSDRERFFITASYELLVTGNLEKARETCELWARTYPRDIQPHPHLRALVYPTLGKYEQGGRGGQENDRARSGFSGRLPAAGVQPVSFSSGLTKPRMRCVARPRASSRYRNWQPSVTTSPSSRATRPEWNERRPGLEASPHRTT